MGLGVAATVLGLFVALILLLAGIIWLPVRRMLRQRKQKQQSQNHPSSTKL
jgi:flagellar biogenesis protein FliO